MISTNVFSNGQPPSIPLRCLPRAAMPTRKTSRRGPAEVHFPRAPLTIMQLRTAQPKVGRRPAPRPWVIEGPDGENLPCSWENVDGMVVMRQMKFCDEESARTFMAIFRRLGHPYPEFTICEYRP